MSLHYHVWFSFKPEVGDEAGLATAREFLAEVKAQGIRCQLLRNLAEADKSKLLPYHALFEFSDQAQMDATFAAKRTEGITVGPHGRLMKSVAAFHVEVFAEL